jgi:PAS domain S-box-containing protein
VSLLHAEPVLILAPAGRDASVIFSILSEADITCRIIPSIGAAVAELAHSGALLVAEEALINGTNASAFFDWIASQPAWSDFPVLLMTLKAGTGSKATTALTAQLGNYSILERPLHPVTMVSAVCSALRARGRQKETERLFAEIKRAAEKLRESEQRFRVMADSAPVLIWMSDLDGNLVFVNRCYEKFFGVPVTEMLGTGWQRAVLTEDLKVFRKAMGESIRTGTPMRGEVRVTDASGQLRWLRSEGVPRTEDGRVVGYIGVNVDVTEARLASDLLEERIRERTRELEAANRQLHKEFEERERIEAVLRQSQRMEAVGQLTSGVAHDFNNLLTVILGNLQFLDREAKGPEKRRLEMMRVAANRGAQLTAQLLAFSRRQRLEPKSVDLNETVSNMRNLLQSTMGGSVRIETVLTRGPWSALVDPTQIEMVILNLAINARDAMEVGGSLTVETANVTIVEEPKRPEWPVPGDYVMVSVTDTGTGMPEDVLDKVFEPFFTTKAVGKGSGLGLSQVLGFAKQSGGGVRIDTKPGEGTTVKVFVPRAAVQADRDKIYDGPPSRESPKLGGRTVLMVDDDSAVRSVTATMLMELGCTVLEAGSGGAALEILARTSEIDLVLIDFAMPGMNGLELSREIKARRPGLPMLFVTGYADLTALNELGEENIIQKPFRDDELARKVSRVLGSAAESRKVVPLRSN